MNTVSILLALLGNLRQMDDRLQKALRDLLNRYYQFLSSTPRHGSRDLRLRPHRDREGRIRRIAWTRRIKTPLRIRKRTVRVTRWLAGPLRPA